MDPQFVPNQQPPQHPGQPAPEHHWGGHPENQPENHSEHHAEHPQENHSAHQPQQHQSHDQPSGSMPQVVQPVTPGLIHPQQTPQEHSDQPRPPYQQQLDNHHHGQHQQYSRDDQPVAVVRVLSVRGVEYLMMSLALWIGAFSFAGMLLTLINGGHSFDVLAFPISVLVVAVGLFTFFFLRLKKAEVQNPALRFDPSKRRLSQTTQVLSYLAIFVSLVGIVYTLIAKMAGSLEQTLWKLVLDFVVVLAVAGGILAYYWLDEHKG